jgi:predicted DNA-binding transcriptional regulator AlpA
MKQTSTKSELITLAAACRRVGIAPATAVRLMPSGEFPESTWLGVKRVVARRRFETWLAEKLGDAQCSDGSAPDAV